MAKQVSVWVGTQKGVFRYRSDEARKTWTLDGPMMAGWETYSILKLPSGELLAGTNHYAYGATVRRSTDDGQTWEQLDERPKYPSDTPYKVNRIWQMVSHPTMANRVYAGVDEAGLFVSDDRGSTWTEIDSLRRDHNRDAWCPGAGGLCLHTILIDPKNPQRMWVGISAVGFFRSDDGGATWKNLNKTLRVMPTGSPDGMTACCVHKVVLDPTNTNRLFMQFHGGVLRSDDAGDTWRAIEKGLPGNFGFPMVITPRGELIIVPLKSEELRYVDGGQLKVYRSTDAGESWNAVDVAKEAEENFVGVLRDAMCRDSLDQTGIYFGTTLGQVYASPDAGQSWQRLPGQLQRINFMHASVE